MSRVVLITGASGGIGAATALKFAQAGDWVAVHFNKNREAAQALCEKIRQLPGGHAEIFQADFQNPQQILDMCCNVSESLGEIEVLINNAGVAQQKLFTDISLSDWERMMSVHLTGCFASCRAVLPKMINKKRGKIINVSSIYGMSGGSCEVHYSAAKAGIIGLTKALALEVAPSGIQVNCVAPGAIDTPMNHMYSAEEMQAVCEETPSGRLGTPEEIAAVIFFLASEDASFITGQVISPNGGLIV